MDISNPFGLPERRYLAGAELEMALPVSLLAPGQSLAVVIITYDQGLQIAFLGIESEVPDIQHIADYTVEALVQLNPPAARSATARQKPAAPKARAKTKGAVG